jgi:hypothetical protein
MKSMPLVKFTIALAAFILAGIVIEDADFISDVFDGLGLFLLGFR